MPKMRTSMDSGLVKFDTTRNITNGYGMITVAALSDTGVLENLTIPELARRYF